MKRQFYIAIISVFISHSQMIYADDLCPNGRSIVRMELKDLKVQTADIKLSNDIVVHLVERAVIVDEKKRDYCKDITVGLVNGATPFGEGGNPRAVPYSYLEKLVFQIQNKQYDLDTTNMYNAWGSQSLERSGGEKYMAAHCYNSETCVLRGIFSGQGGLYVAEWIVQQGKPYRTVLSDSTDLVDFFMKGGINPPIFD